MYISNKPDQELDHDLILEKFKSGEISISRAFKLLAGLGDSNNIVPKKDPSSLKETGSRQLKQGNIDRVLKVMDRLIGLEDVKALIKEYIAFLQVQSLRREFGLKAEPIVMHMIFKGNPGTGKTTMARIIGELYKELGLLKNGELIEAERADLVGEYIGHTAQKTKKIIQKALGGVLFIDEAYSLARGGEKDFGKEAIDSMVKAMEDYKDELVIILAGYRDEMDYFLEVNPGLRSRFSIQLDFSDYTIDELVEIAELMFKEREYILNRESKHYIYRVLTYIRNQEGLISGNARTVRNLVEKAIRHQAGRVLKEKVVNRKTLMIINKEDLAGGVVEDD